MEKKPVTNPVLKTWIGLNDALRTADEDLCRELFREEKNGRSRSQFLSRIHSRLNKVRADREREEMEALKDENAATHDD